MKLTLAIDSFNVNNSTRQEPEFTKYSIDVSLNEISSTENSCELKYGYIFSSIPKGIQLNLEGFVNCSGNPSELAQIYQKDSEDIPNILRMSYQELYPVLFMITKSMKIPCPPYELTKTVDSIMPETLDAETSETLDAETSETLDAEPTETLDAEPTETLDAEPTEKNTENSEFDSLSTEELTQLQIDLNSEYAKTPSDELKTKIDLATKILNQKISDSLTSS